MVRATSVSGFYGSQNGRLAYLFKPTIDQVQRVFNLLEEMDLIAWSEDEPLLDKLAGSIPLPLRNDPGGCQYMALIPWDEISDPNNTKEIYLWRKNTKTEEVCFAGPFPLTVNDASPTDPKPSIQPYTVADLYATTSLSDHPSAFPWPGRDEPENPYGFDLGGHSGAAGARLGPRAGRKKIIT